MSVSKALVYRFAVLALAALSVPAFAAAQRGGMAGGHAAMGHAGPAIMHAAPATHFSAAAGGRMAGGARIVRVRAGGGPARVGGPGPARINGGVRNPRINNFNNNFGPGFGPGFGQTTFNNVPGLGFDYPHLAAINGGRPFGRGFERGFGGGRGFFDGGFLWGWPSDYVDQPATEEAQPNAADVIAANGVPNDYYPYPDPAQQPRRMYPADPGPAPAAQPSAPVPDVAQYVFVKRDGGLEFAVAYSWVNDTLRYVTPDGRRRTMTRDALDLNATEQFNEQRGIEFHAPA